MSSQAVTANSDAKPLTSPILGVSTTIGIGGVLLMGVVSWIMLLLNRDLPIAAVLIVSLLSYGIFNFLLFRNLEGAWASVGVAGGLIGGSVSLVFLGSLMVIQPESLVELETQKNQFSFIGLLLVLGVVLGMVLMGWAAGVVRSKRPNYSSGGVDWRARYAWVVAASYLPLIAVGGLVTSTESGLAVPDSVTTYGSISVLFPMSLMGEIRIYLEHSHRIFGTFAGLATIVLVIRMFGAPAKMLPRLMSVMLLIGVILQGVMGALRVSEESQALATLHGVLAQLVFALAIATGVVCSKRWNTIRPGDEAIDTARLARLMLILTTIGLCIQLIFGSMTRHMDSGHALMSHIGFSFIVVLLAIVAGAMCIRVGKKDRGVEGGAGAIRPYGAVIHGLVILQFTMGWGALAMTRTGDQGHPELPTAAELATAHGIRVGEAIVTSSHHLLGALLLATVVGALMWAIRIASRARTC